MKKTGLTFILVLAVCFVGKAQTTRYFQFEQHCGGMNTADTLFVVATNVQSVIDTVLVDIAKPLNERNRHINGIVTHGNGGFNHNGNHWFLWHFIPNQWTVAELTIELCDGCPTDISILTLPLGDSINSCGWGTRPVAEVSNPLGINENSFKNKIILYPNPAKDKLNLKWNGLNDISVTIYNSIGQELSTILLPKQNEIIDITGLQDGLYFLKIIDGNKTEINKIIVIGI
jgi:hypothetical protein